MARPRLHEPVAVLSALPRWCQHRAVVLAASWSYAAWDDPSWYPISHALGGYYVSPSAAAGPGKLALRCTRGSQCLPSHFLNCQQDLAPVLPALDMAVRLRGIRQREGRIDIDGEPPGRNAGQ